MLNKFLAERVLFTFVRADITPKKVAQAWFILTEQRKQQPEILTAEHIPFL